MATAGVVVRDAWIETMEPTLMELFTWGYDDNKEWEKIWTKKPSTKRREEIFEYVKPDVVQETPEGSPYIQLSIERVRTASVLHADYTGMVIFSHQMKRDKQYDDMEEQSWGLGEAINRKMEEEALSYYFNGFDTAHSPDELSWFNTAHACAKSTATWSNRSNEALSPDGLNNLHVKMLETLNENGKITPAGRGSLQLIHPAPLRRLSKQLAMKGEYEPGSANFDKNIFEVDPVCLPMLAMAPSSIRATQWYLRDTKKAKNYFFLREGPKFEMFTNPYTDDTIVKARVAFSFLLGSPRGVAGSTGV